MSETVSALAVAPTVTVDTSAIEAAIHTAVLAAVAVEKTHTAEVEAELVAAEAELTASEKPETVATPSVAAPAPATVTVTNTSGLSLIASAPRTAPHNMVFRRGSTEHVPEAFWDEWLSRNAGSDVIKNGLISAK